MLNSMGMLQAERGKYAAACPYFLVQLGVNTTAEIKPGSLWYVLREDFCRDLLAAIERQPDFPNPRYDLALAFVREGELEEAQSGPCSI